MNSLSTFFTATLLSTSFFVGSAKASELTDLVKTEASKYKENVVTTPKATTYSINVVIPQGYDAAILQYNEFNDGTQSFLLRLYKNIETGKELTLLADKDADTTLDNAYRDTGVDYLDAYNNVHAKGKNAEIDITRNIRDSYNFIISTLQKIVDANKQQSQQPQQQNEQQNKQ